MALGPLFWSAVVVLVANDWWFKKSDFSGIVTGKLSDVAGMYAMSVLLTAWLSSPEREARSSSRSLGVSLVVALLFGAVKLSSDVRVMAEHVWGWILVPLRLFVGELSTRPISIIEDHTDLVAIPFAFLGGQYVRRRWRRRIDGAPVALSSPPAA